MALLVELGWDEVHVASNLRPRWGKRQWNSRPRRFFVAKVARELKRSARWVEQAWREYRRHAVDAIAAEVTARLDSKDPKEDPKEADMPDGRGDEAGSMAFQGLAGALITGPAGRSPSRRSAKRRS
jgi:hypothetical protein